MYYQPPLDVELFDDDECVIVEGEPEPLSTSEAVDLLVRVVRRAELEPLTFHTLRHSQVALLIGQGEHPKLIADRVGHSSPVVTMTIYAHLFPGLDAAAADRLNDLRIQAAADPTRTQQNRAFRGVNRTVPKLPSYCRIPGWALQGSNQGEATPTHVARRNGSRRSVGRD